MGYTASRQYPDEAPLSERNEDDSGFNLSPLRGLAIFLRAVDVPGAALRTGREVLDSIARSD
ncbi:hypothetical protein LP421_04490 (plasmid) [Rhizobium sp. RCAM05350]|nr:hypothetical protein LP421_04490 [Rhizobium sp. RCAM05350]